MLPRVVFMGTPEFAVPTLERLAALTAPILGVVTRPDKPRGRGQHPSPSPVSQAASRLGLPVWQPASINDPAWLAALAGKRPELVIVAAFGQILKPALLALPALGCINVHASLLPRYRGAAPIAWALARGESETGVTVQKMAPAVDSGDILVQLATPIAPEETAVELYARLALLGADAAAQAVNEAARLGRLDGVAQDESLATFAPMLKREDGQMDWTLRAGEIHDRVRAFVPWPGTFGRIKGRILKILRTRVDTEALEADSLPGTILAVDETHGWHVAVGGAARLWISLVQGENGKPMAPAAYGRGHRIQPGDRWDEGSGH